MRVLVVGRGQVGTFLASRWALPLELHWREQMEDLTVAALAELRPDAVVSAAATTRPDWCEVHPAESRAANLEAPVDLALRLVAAVGGGARFLHLGSGCVWRGRLHPDGRPYLPTDPETPACLYAFHKGAADRALLALPDGPRVLILRPRQIFSSLLLDRNYLMRLMGYPRLIDVPQSLSSIESVARALEAGFAGIFDDVPMVNVFDDGLVSAYQIGVRLASAGLRAPPELLPRAELDGMVTALRVDTVIDDPHFRARVYVEPAWRALERHIMALAARIPPSRGEM
jgi:hypothetical protein